MKIIDKGYKYEVHNHNTKEVSQSLKFVKKAKTIPKGEVYVKQKGTTTEEVLNVLIDRVNSIGEDGADEEAVQHLEKVKILLA